MRSAAATRLGLVILSIVLWSHGLIVAGASGDSHSRLWGRVIDGLQALGIGEARAGVLLGGAAGALVLVFQAALAGGVEGIRPAVLLAPLLTALSPTFARGVLGGGEEVFFACLLFAGSVRAFRETHRPGSFPLSALCFGASAALGWGGLVALAAAFAHRLLFARRFRLPAAVYRYAWIWLAVGLLTFALFAVWVGWPAGGAVSGRPLADPTTASPSAAGIGLVLTRLWAEVDGLAALPYLLVLVMAWKPKDRFFVLTLSLILTAAWLPVAARAPAAAVGAALVPAIPLVMLVIGEGVRGAIPVLETAGLGPRPRAWIITLAVVALALGQVWPTIRLLAERAGG
jgi:hypothetical protein